VLRLGVDLCIGTDRSPRHPRPLGRCESVEVPAEVEALHAERLSISDWALEAEAEVLHEVP
jgi:hypothetical protein